MTTGTKPPQIPLKQDRERAFTPGQRVKKVREYCMTFAKPPAGVKFGQDVKPVPIGSKGVLVKRPPNVEPGVCVNFDGDPLLRWFSYEQALVCLEPTDE